MSFLLQDQNYDPEEETRRRQSAVKVAKQKLLQAIVDSYNLNHQINTKTGAIQKRSLTALQMKQHKQAIQVARNQRTQKEKSICCSIEKVKRLDQEIRQLQHKSVH